MKKILLLISFMITSIVAESQITFAPVGTEYNYSVIKDVMIGIPTLVNIFSEKDTIVNGTVNRKLMRTEHNFAAAKPPISSMLIRQSNDSIFIDEVFTYNQGAKEGDTVVTGGHSRFDEYFLILDSIRYIQIFSALRKVFYWRQSSTLCMRCKSCVQFQPIIFVENYGPINDYLSLQFVRTCVLGRNLGYNYTCGRFEGAIYHKSINSSLSCSPLEITRSEQQQKAKLFPTLSNSFVEIESNFDIETVEIFNSVGSKVYESPEHFLGTFVKIEVLQLRPGSYFAKINGGSVSVLPFVRL
ncbi:MAG TPA: hypothetical protein VF691_03365 [Cytophagaceae bacterium]|jgi:hypothetical protein